MRGGFKRSRALAVALCLATTPAPGAALAHDTAGEKPTTAAGRAALARHDNFEKLGQAFDAINDELKKGRPDRALIARNAQAVRALSEQVPTWFPKGTGQEARPQSEAKADIWTDAAGFSAAAASAQAQAARLQHLSATGDLPALKAQAREADAACKACHARFRVVRDKS